MGAQDRALLGANKGILRLGEELRDFADTAGVVAALDLVISVDTAVAPLAGAMAKPGLDLAPLCAQLALAPRPRGQPLGARLFRVPLPGD